MKKLLCLGFTALTMLFAMPGVVRAEGEGDAHFTFNPAPSATAMDAGTKLELDYTGEAMDVIYYHWFANEAAAKAAEFDGGEWAMYMSPNFVPELTAATPVLRVLALDENEDIIDDSIVVYTVKAAPVPAVNFTFAPVSGSRVAPDAKITVTAELGDGEEIDYKWCTKDELATAEWAMDWEVYETEQPTAALARGLTEDTLYLKVAVVADAMEVTPTIKGYGQATYIVTEELRDKLIIVPNGTELVRVGDSVSVTVKFGDGEIDGDIVYKWYATADEANADMDLENATNYVETSRPVITREKPVLAVGYKNDEGWIINPEIIEYIFDPVVDNFTVAAAGKNEVKDGTVVFDGMASFNMKAEGVIGGLRVAVKLYSKDYKDTITTDWYEATDTLAQFVGIYNGEYAVNFSLRHFYTAAKDSVLADTTIYFNVTNYEEPVQPVNPEFTLIAAGNHKVQEDGTVVFNEAAFTMQITGELIKGDSLGNYTVSIELYTKAAFDTFGVVDSVYVYGADSMNSKTLELKDLKEGEYVAHYFMTRINGLMPEILEAKDVFFNVTAEPLAIENVELAGVNVYPNPNNGSFNVAVPERAVIDIFGLNGAKVMSREANAGVETFSINHSGIYFVRVMAGNKTAVKRVVVR